MSRQAKLFLGDILEAIEAIEKYVDGGEAAFRADEKTRYAVQMRLIEIGEATRRIQELGLKLAEIEPGIEWSKIAGMRDLIAHHYWRVSETLLWTTVQNSLQPLKKAVKSLLKKRMPEPPASAPRSAAKKG